ncbi:HET-domain-containing protein [Paramyrothecium foliicola]|nr:HET-domain-containing protein [Paramyrothecium foliicola]
MVLSRRILHFLDKEKVIFEDASGVFIDNSRGIYHVHGIPSFIQGLSFESGVALDGPKLNLEDSYADSTRWYRLIEGYSVRKLTFWTDRLPAIAGLADHYSQIHQDGAYLFGLWSISFYQGLLWNTLNKNAAEIEESPPGGQFPLGHGLAGQGR